MCKIAARQTVTDCCRYAVVLDHTEPCMCQSKCEAIICNPTYRSCDGVIQCSVCKDNIKRGHGNEYDDEVLCVTCEVRIEKEYY